MLFEIDPIFENKERLKQFFFKDIFRDKELCYRLYHEIYPDSENEKRFVDFRVCPLDKEDYRFSKKVYKIQDGDELLYVIFNDAKYGDREQNELRHYVAVTVYNEIQRRASLTELVKKGRLGKRLKRKLPRFLIVQDKPYIKKKNFDYSSDMRWFLKIPYNVQIRVVTIKRSRSVLRKIVHLNALIDKLVVCTIPKAHHLTRLIFECTKKSIFKPYFQEMSIRKMSHYILNGLEIEKREERNIYLPSRK